MKKRKNGKARARALLKVRSLSPNECILIIRQLDTMLTARSPHLNGRIDKLLN